MMEILAERNFPVTELIPVASEKSIGKSVVFKGKFFPVVLPQQGIELKPTLALFSAGGSMSVEWAPQYAKAGIRVVDNSSAWRMDATKKLIVPEINANVLVEQDFIIANPNCSTIQMVLALYPLHKQFGIKRVVVSTYQSVTGTGKKAVDQLLAERRGELPSERAYQHPIDLNLIPQVDVFLENGYTKEEMKMVNETQKILGNSALKITATTVRVPVVGGHSESVNVEFERDFDLKEIFQILGSTPGVVVQDDISRSVYPMPLTAHNKDEVFVGRIRRDFSQPNTLNFWCVSDNLRKGAATNAIQIAEVLLAKGWIK
jgi:aspartate-semialdehyde dehydrogenase